MTNADEFRRLGHRAVDLAADYLNSLAQRSVFSPMTPEERQALLDQPLLHDGIAPDEAIDFLRDHVMTHPMGNGHPRFFGWVNSPPALFAAVTDLLAAVMNPSCAGGDHAAIYLERAAVRWLMELVGFPTDGSMGLLVSGGSVATVTALAAARHHAASADGWNVRTEGLQAGRPRLVLYQSAEGHSSIRKAVELLGLGADAIRSVPVDAAYRMDVDQLRTAIRKDRAAGLRPFCVAASAGTVMTGAIDPMDQIADLCAGEGLWLHIDGAYGAVGILDHAVSPLYRGMERADSLTVDPHKWLSVPVECGCIMMRNGSLLREAFSFVPAYIRTEEGKGFGGLPWYSEYGFQQTRGFRALKLWATLVERGRDGLAETIERHNRLAGSLADRIRAAPDLELCAPVSLSIVCFRYVPEHLRADEERLNALNKRIMEAVQAGGRAFLTNAVLNGRFVLRACIIHYATVEKDIEALLEAVRMAGENLAVK